MKLSKRDMFKCAGALLYLMLLLVDRVFFNLNDGIYSTLAIVAIGLMVLGFVVPSKGDDDKRNRFNNRL